ncbi:MAG: DUF2190 family protein [Micrococcus sp.]|nr:DUF2190 family protein [Micrococcus sp.]
MADYLPLFKPGEAVTYQASADITGGQLVEVTGDRTIGPAGADSAKSVGVAGFDAATGDNVTVYSGGIQRPVASGAIAAGDRVGPAAAGRVATAATVKIGTALAAAADGEPAQIKLDN